MMTFIDRVNIILWRIAYKNWWIIPSSIEDENKCYLQVRFIAPNSNDPNSDPVVQHGRKWLISPHMTDSEIVSTAFKAVLSAEEHECRERFLYRGRAIFGPHFNVDKLCELVDMPDAYDARKET